jgi:hypothetical protein
VRFVHTGNGFVTRTFVGTGLPQGVPAPNPVQLNGTASGYLSLRLTAMPASVSVNANNAPVGTAILSPTMVIELRNISNTSIAVGDVAPTGSGPEPIIVNSTCRNATLEAGAACTVQVRFSHTANGSLSRSFAVQGVATQHADSGPVTLTSTASGFMTPPPPSPPGSSTPPPSNPPGPGSSLSNP